MSLKFERIDWRHPWLWRAKTKAHPVEGNWYVGVDDSGRFIASCDDEIGAIIDNHIDEPLGEVVCERFGEIKQRLEEYERRLMFAVTATE